MSVATTIVSYRSAEDICALLDALAQQTHRDLSVQVCENGGAQAYDDLLQALEAGAMPSQQPSRIRASG